MADEAITLSRAAPAGAGRDDGDYQAFSELLTASARGRAFLAEHVRRSHAADTGLLLAALARLESSVRAQGEDKLRGELAALLVAIRGARPEIAASDLPTRAAKLALLLDLLERRIAGLAAPATAAPAESGRAISLTVVPAPEEPELPIPSPAAAQPPQLALAQPQAAAGVAPIPEDEWLGHMTAAPAAAAMVEPQAQAQALTPEPIAAIPAAETATAAGIAAAVFDCPPPEAIAPAGVAAVAPAPERTAPKAPAASTAGPQTQAPAPDAAQNAQESHEPYEPHTAHAANEKERLWLLSAARLAPPPDPLAALMVLSEEERLALFT